MKILLTGCAGFIGSHVYESLASAKYNIYGIDDLSFGYADATNYGFLVDDFINMKENQLKTYDIIVHLATVNIQHSHENPIDTFKTNSLKTIELFRKFKGKIVYTSTASVYGNTEKLPSFEDDPVNVTGAYDMSKYIVEMYLKLRGDYTTLRLSNVFGKTVPNRKYTNVIESFTRSDIVTIQGDGRQSRDFTHVKDVVRAIEYAVIQPAKNTEINICSGEETNLLEIAYLMDKKAIFTDRRPGDIIQRRWLSRIKALKLLGWQPEISLQKGLKML